MILSLNEIEGTVFKAARGVGMSWGLAEEAAIAARWLAGRGIDFGCALLALLDAPPNRASGCPIAMGALISDHGGVPGSVRLDAVRSPVLLLPFLARLAHDAGVITVEYNHHQIWFAQGGLHGSPEALSHLARLSAGAGLRIARSDAAPAPNVTHWPLRHDGCRLVSDVWVRINALAARTYVSASTQSRISGAGAGASDND